MSFYPVVDYLIFQGLIRRKGFALMNVKLLTIINLKKGKLQMRKLEDRNLTPIEKQKILEKYDNVCVYCFGDADQVDHVLPWSYKHDDSEDNLVTSCWLCNLIGSNKIFDSFRLKQEYIQAKRYYWIKKNPIPLWVREDVEKLGYSLRKKVEDSVVILDNVQDRCNTRDRLLKEGFRVL